MRTTVDLPDPIHRRAADIARRQHRSLSSVVAELTARGLAQLDAPVELSSHPLTGLPVISVGRQVSPEDVAEALDDA